MVRRHTVCYDDGEVGMHRLWQHDERIRLGSPVEQWPRDAALARHCLTLAHEKLRSSSRDAGRRVAVRYAALHCAALPAWNGKAWHPLLTPLPPYSAGFVRGRLACLFAAGSRAAAGGTPTGWRRRAQLPGQVPGGAAEEEQGGACAGGGLLGCRV